MGSSTLSKLTLNTVALARGLFITPDPERTGGGDSRLAASLHAELMNLGYILDDAAFTAASRAPRDWLIAYYNEVIPQLRSRLGAGRPYTPFYRNFPEQVMAMDDFELFVNAVVHYWSNGRWEPPQELQQRGFAFENVEFKPLRLGIEADLRRAFTKMVSINQSLTEQDKAVLVWLIQTYGGALELPPVVPFMWSWPEPPPVNMAKKSSKRLLLSRSFRLKRAIIRPLTQKAPRDTNDHHVICGSLVMRAGRT